MIKKVGHLTVDRVDLSRGVADAERVARVLREDTSLFFFPEGTFVRAPGVRQFRLGAFKTAVDAKCAVIPVALRGTRDILPANTWLPRRGTITVTIGKPIVPAGSEWHEIVRLRDLTRNAIVSGSGEARRRGASDVFAGSRVYFARTVMTGHRADASTRDATLPRIAFATPLRPWVPMTIMSTRRAFASRTIRSCVTPMSSKTPRARTPEAFALATSRASWRRPVVRWLRSS